MSVRAKSAEMSVHSQTAQRAGGNNTDVGTAWHRREAPPAPRPRTPALPAPAAPARTCQLFLDWHTALRKGSRAGMPRADATTAGSRRERHEVAG